MIFRLLYRLILQRVDQSRRKHRLLKATSALAMPSQQQTISQNDKHRVLKRLFVLALVFTGLIILGWQFFKLSPSSPMTNVNHAELRLQILSSNTWPLVVYLQGTGLPETETSSSPPQISQIESINGAFVPAFQVIPPAGTLELINGDAIAHNTHVFNRGDTIFNVALPLPGIAVRKSLTGSGIFSVRCDLHPWMQAWLFVPPSRHYAVLYEPNSVSFPDIPPGQYVLHLWQADNPEHLRLISLAAGETKTLRLP